MFMNNDMAFAKASQVLRELWDGYLPIDPVQLAQKMGARVVFDSSLDREGISGSFEYDSYGPLIKVNAYDPPARQRFTVAHEIAHWILGHVQPGELAHRDPSDPYAVVDTREVDANRFAAQLLMPAHVAQHLVEQVPPAQKTSILAQQFSVSEAAMGYRLRNLGL
ncbi:Zn-dependent peptidase ImmA (M78 family) [Pseudomonas marginalis]|uniref:ImmA/IrrE family metallo-endopeptidase n=1 Tax=Pseudomonas TaxID=286 RepID=UPI0020A19A8E|nr:MULTISPECIES: ImmA/IrrE family metallo-endopeptidase [Pseudomonas]MCP1505324.1 Zn-dependent peptidase ImmA (M78 family) [Pseudomonas marginalis]MCP1522828.1 Zn-dependent peptidase ImmA (M78 family) [Pseudomonas marginalis]MDQ0497854.1 Zn-dependent peptidase ImmA (M78 family) [Pseudomonas marginalis]